MPETISIDRRIARSTNNRWLVALLLAALGVELYFLLSDVPILSPAKSAQEAAPKLAPIAELMQHENEVRVQDPGALVWERSADGQTLYRKQSVLTSDRSRAEIAFLDGTGLVLDANSLIQLEKNPADDGTGYQKIVIHLLRGTIHKREPRKQSQILRQLAQTTPELEIRVGNSAAEISPQSELSVTAAPDAPGGDRIIVHAGEIQVESPAGAVMARAGQEIHVAPEASKAKPTATDSPFALVAPVGGQSTLTHGETRVRFRWRVKNPRALQSPLELEASRDPEFKTDVRKLRITSTEPPVRDLEAELGFAEPGEATEWHWRVRTVDGEVVSPIETFWLQPAPKPAARFPAAALSVQKGQPVDFGWSEVSGASGYELEIQRQSGGSAPRREQISSGTIFRAEHLDPGQYRWRVRANLGGGPGDWSAEQSFSVTSPDDAPPPPPSELMAPEIEPRRVEPAPRHSFIDWLEGTAWADELDDRAPASEKSWTIHLRWAPVKGVKHYHVEIGRERTFKHIIDSVDTDGPEWNWPYTVGMENSKGRVFYRVASMSESGKTGAYSRAKAIEIPKWILRAQQVAKRDAARRDTFDAVDADAVPTAEALAGEKHPKPEAPGPAPTIGPSPEPIPSATPQAASTEAAKPGYELGKHLRYLAGLFAGIGNLHESGADAGLTSVQQQRPFAQERVDLGATVLNDEKAPRFTLQAELWLASFSVASIPRVPAQDRMTGVQFHLRGLYWLHGSEFAGPWKIAVGASVDREFRFVKNGPQAIELSGGFSGGPAIEAARELLAGSALKPAGLAIRLDFPVLGGIAKSFVGFGAGAWSEWHLSSFGSPDERALDLGLKLEGDASTTRWSTPVGGSITAWSLWVAPTLSF